MKTYKVMLISPDGSRYLLYFKEGESIFDAAKRSGFNFTENSFQGWRFSTPESVNSDYFIKSLNYIDSLLNLPDETESYFRNLGSE